ncbi:MAG: HDOD domain-containing protein [Aestuariibacter sp.]
MFNTKSTAVELTHGFRIPSKPAILLEVEEKAAEPEFELSDLGEIISKDPALSSSVLQVVNASANGLNRTISDISQAVCFLGVTQLKAIIAIYKMREEYGQNLAIKLERFWDETVATGGTMLYINKWLGNKLKPDTLYSLGLFHDCGIAAMAFKYDDYMKTLQEANDRPDVLLYDLENEKYKTDHATVGYFITSSWHLPKGLCKMVRYHHDIEVIKTKFPREIQEDMAVLHIAEDALRSTRRSEESDWFNENKALFLGWLDMSDEDYENLKDDVDALGI